MNRDDEGFLSRWSRRKALARAGQPLPSEEAGMPERSADAVPTPQPSAHTGSVQVPPPIENGAQVENQSEGGTQPPTLAPAPPPPTLEDVRQLSLDADFRPFVDRRVPPEVRNAALRKLFSDPHFNVMDGLDVYIDDYSRPDPLPTALARRLVAAQFMGLFEQRPAPGAAKTVEDAAPASKAALPPVTGEAPAEPPCASSLGHSTADAADGPDATDSLCHPPIRPPASAT